MGKIIQITHGQSVNSEVLYALDEDGNIYRSEYDPSTKTHGEVEWLSVTLPESR